MIQELCPLCDSDKELFFRGKQGTYYQCQHCRGVFVASEHHPEYEEELARYREHNNDVNDIRYQKFVEPIVQAVTKYFGPGHKGLDFGAGTGPVISALLHKKAYQIELYDPFFHNHPELLNRKYDYIVCCEVMEHFHKPAKEFELLANLLNAGGKLFCMTNIFEPGIDFGKWYYKNDKTHVFFYPQETLEYIRENNNFSTLEISNNLIIFSR
jgi:2-polyprenyl-3-methyl-5-hydroxy-6-metoxy-1,4-benzoquinol methylase